MPKRLHRYYGSGHLHFLTTSCYHRRPLLGNSRRRDRFLEILEQVRRRYGFAVVGYVVMPEHVHLLISEPDRGTPLDGWVSDWNLEDFIARMESERKRT